MTFYPFGLSGSGGGGVSKITFTFGSSGAAPASGTYTAGTVAVDQNGVMRVCTVGGSPGTWARTGAEPYQFWVDDYGAKGDGVQCLVNVVNGNATVNTTPLGAPAAPTLSNAGSGGSLTAGTYQVEVTYVNPYGETVASSSSSQAIAGVQPLTISTPLQSGNATGWYAYVTQAGAGTYFRQQAAGSPTPLGVSLVLTANPTTSGANPPGADSSATQIFTSTAVDGGKNVMICGAAGIPGGPAIDTINTVVSATQATLTTGASTITNTANGCAMVFSSDDRIAIDNCIQAAAVYALANENKCRVIGSNKVYGLGTGLFQASYNGGGGGTPGTYTYNTQVRIPVANSSGQTAKLEFELLGPGENAHNYFWASQLPNLNGFTLVSYSVGPNSANATYGQQSVIGAPLGGASTASNGFFNVKPVIKGVQVVQPGWSNSIGIDLLQAGGFLLRGSSQAYAPTSALGGAVNASNGWLNNATWQARIGLGLRTPNVSNNDDCVIETFATEGLTIGVLNQADHLVINRLATINEYFGMKLNTNPGTHDLTIDQWSYENITGGGFQVLGSSPVTVDIVMDGENSDGAIVYDLQDNGNNLHGIIRWNDINRTVANAPTIQGGANVQIINRNISRVVQSAPSYTLGTAFQNPWWLDTWVTLSGGTVTNVQVGPTSAAATTSLATATPVTFRLPTGWWLNITGTVKPTTFIGIPE